jgi:hypothetical protein
MKRVLAAIAVAVLVLLAVPGPRANAQSPPPVTTDTTSDDGGRPWGRLAIFVPVSLALGAGAVYGRRFARDRNWMNS